MTVWAKDSDFCCEGGMNAYRYAYRMAQVSVLLITNNLDEHLTSFYLNIYRIYFELKHNNIN